MSPIGKQEESFKYLTKQKEVWYSPYKSEIAVMVKEQHLYATISPNLHFSDSGQLSVHHP